MKTENFYKTISVTLVVLTICFGIVFYALGWNPPGDIPPDGNVAPPINESTADQIKFGPLRIGGVFRADSATYLGVSGGNIGIGTTTPSEKLDVQGNIVASGSICANGGADCIGSGGGGAPTITSYCNVSTYPNCNYIAFGSETSIGQHDVCFLQSFGETRSSDRDWCVVRNNGDEWTVTRRYASCIVTCLDW